MAQSRAAAPSCQRHADRDASMYRKRTHQQFKRRHFLNVTPLQTRGTEGGRAEPPTNVAGSIEVYICTSRRSDIIDLVAESHDACPYPAVPVRCIGFENRPKSHDVDPFEISRSIELM